MCLRFMGISGIEDIALPLIAHHIVSLHSGNMPGLSLNPQLEDLLSVIRLASSLEARHIGPRKVRQPSKVLSRFFDALETTGTFSPLPIVSAISRIDTPSSCAA